MQLVQFQAAVGMRNLLTLFINCIAAVKYKTQTIGKYSINKPKRTVSMPLRPQFSISFLSCKQINCLYITFQFI